MLVSGGGVNCWVTLRCLKDTSNEMARTTHLWMVWIFAVEEEKPITVFLPSQLVGIADKKVEVQAMRRSQVTFGAMFPEHDIK